MSKNKSIFDLKNEIDPVIVQAKAVAKSLSGVTGLENVAGQTIADVFWGLSENLNKIDRLNSKIWNRYNKEKRTQFLTAVDKPKECESHSGYSDRVEKQSREEFEMMLKGHGSLFITVERMARYYGIGVFSIINKLIVESEIAIDESLECDSPEWKEYYGIK